MSQTIPVCIADFETQLSTAIGVGSTGFSIASIVDDDGNNIPDGKYCCTVDNGSSNKEYLMGDSIAGVFSNVVSVSRQGIETTGSVRSHRVGASVILTDFVALQKVANILRGTGPLDGSNPIAYDAAPILSDGKQLATVAYVLSIVTGGTVNFSSQTISATAGENLSSPNISYFKESDQRWYKSSAQTSSTYDQVRLGIANTTALASAGVTIQISGIASGFSGLTPGSKYYLSDTAGGVSATPGTITVFLGWAVNSTSILFNPQQIYWPTKLEKDFLAQVSVGGVGIISQSASRTAGTGYLPTDGSAVAISSYPSLFAALFPSKTFTVTIASPGVFSSTSHGLKVGDRVRFKTTGLLPTGLLTTVYYYVISAGFTANAFEVSTTYGGSAVNTSGTQSGVHTVFISNYGFGDGSSTFNIPYVLDTTNVPPTLGVTSSGTTSTTHVITTENFLYATVISSSSTPPTMQYNSIAMTLIDTIQSYVSGTRYVHTFYLANPATGSHTLNASAGTPTNIAAASFFNVSTLDTSSKGASATTFITSFANSITPNASNCLVVMGVDSNATSTITPPPNWNVAIGANSLNIIYNNSSVGGQLLSGTFTPSTSTPYGQVTASFLPLIKPANSQYQIIKT